VIILPNEFLDDFFGYPNIAEEDVRRSTEDFILLNSQRDDEREGSQESEDPLEADGVREALRELQESRSTWIEALRRGSDETTT
jgi:hypothetical protein